MSPFISFTVPALLLAVALHAQARPVVCHVDYGGETRRIAARPVASPYAVPAVEIGSYFLFRLVVEADGTAKTYVHANRDDLGPVPLHQATFPPRRPRTGPHGFSGLHFVYEPVRDGELKFWCE